MAEFNPSAHLKAAANAIETRFKLSPLRIPKAALVLGTGWGDVLPVEHEEKLPLRDVPGFETLKELHGHRRVLSYGQVGGKWVIALRGRVHQYEGLHDPSVDQMVRLQVEMLLEIGARTFILTNAAGALGDRASVGSVVVTDGFISLFAPPPPLRSSEMWCADDVLDPALIQLAKLGGPHTKDLTVLQGGYLMVRGPNFEGRKYDKLIMQRMLATCVGMSTFPEASALAGYAKSGVKVLAMSYITNDDKKAHSHEANLEQAQRKAVALGVFLEHLVKSLP